jgi:predicted RNA binding protein YcfA (HicA-like mRNA interferase family)
MTGKDMIKLYKENGWKIKRITKHYIMEKNGEIEPVPYHTKELPKGTKEHLLRRLKEV